MYAYIIGIVEEINRDHIVVETNQIGYMIYFADTSKIKLKAMTKIYTYQVVREDDISLFGFLTAEDRSVFLKLIEVKGIGPKTAMNLLSKVTATRFIQAIEQQDVSFLKSLPGIGAKSAQQIVLDLKGKLVFHDNDKVVSLELEDALNALKSLGYKASELKSIETELIKSSATTVDEYVKIGLQLLLKRKGG